MNDLNAWLPQTPESATHWLLSISVGVCLQAFASPNTTLYLLQFHLPSFSPDPNCYLPISYLVTQHIPSPMGSKAQESSLIHLLPLPHLYQPSHKSQWLSLQNVTQIWPFPTSPSGPFWKTLESLHWLQISSPPQFSNQGDLIILSIRPC